MNAAILKKLGSHYIVAMMLITRLIASVGGVLTIYYVNLTLRLRLEGDARLHFHVIAVIVILLAVAMTVLAAPVGDALFAPRSDRLERGASARRTRRRGGRTRGGRFLWPASPSRRDLRAHRHACAGLFAHVLVGWPRRRRHLRHRVSRSWAFPRR